MHTSFYIKIISLPMRTQGPYFVLHRNDFNHEGTTDTKKGGEAEKEAPTVELRNLDNSIFITSP